MKNVLIIYCHPYEKSFDHAVLEEVETNLLMHGLAFKIIDLHADRFDPIYSKEELALYDRGETSDPLVVHYQDALRWADGLVVVTPIWWHASLPAMLKGFVDKVLTAGQGYRLQGGMRGLLTNIQTAYVLTSSPEPTFYLRLHSSKALEDAFLTETLKQLGIRKRRWVNFGRRQHANLRRRQRYLSKVAQLTFSF